MKISIVMLMSVVLAGCTNPRGPRQAHSANTTAGAAAQNKTLFLHLLEPPTYTDPPIPAHRIVTARIYPSQNFSISIGDADDPFTNRWDGALTVAQFTNGVAVARPLEPIWNSGDAVLAGRIDRVNGKFLAQLQGRSHTTVNYFHGEIELDKPVDEQGCLFAGGAIWGVWFVLSESHDCGNFLKALDDGTLRPPAVVDRNSAAAKQWEGQASPAGVLQILNGEPGAAPNAAPPHR